MVELRQQQADHLDEIDTLKAMAERDKTNIGALVEQVEAGRKEQESEHAEREVERKREGEMRNHTEQERDELRDAVCRLEKEIAVLNHAIETDRQKARQRECAQDEAVAANMMLLENEIDRSFVFMPESPARGFNLQSCARVIHADPSMTVFVSTAG